MERMLVLNIDHRIEQLGSDIRALRWMLDNRHIFPCPDDYPANADYAERLARTEAHQDRLIRIGAAR